MGVSTGLIPISMSLIPMQYNDLLKKKKIVENDKAKIAELIEELDQKKNEALRGAYKRVNQVGGGVSVASFPGSTAQLFSHVVIKISAYFTTCEKKLGSRCWERG